MKNTLISITLLIALASCGSDSESGNPTPSSTPTTTPPPNGLNPEGGNQVAVGLTGVTEISFQDYKEIMQGSASTNQMMSPGEQYSMSETLHKSALTNSEDCKIERKIKKTLVEHNKTQDFIKVLIESDEEQIGSDCSIPGQSSNRYIEQTNNFSQRIGFDDSSTEGVTFYKGTENDQIYLIVSTTFEQEGEGKFGIELKTDPKRPMWMDDLKQKVTLNGAPYMDTEATDSLMVDLETLDYEGLDIYIVQD
jgi:hypothetical protein